MKAAPALHIGKLRSRFVSAQAIDPAQVRQWHEALSEQDPADIVGRVVADDEWLLIRRLPLHVRWRDQSAGTEVGRVWAQALQGAVEQAASLEDVHNVVRYRLWRHGLADMLYRSALGEVDRQWAWQRMGLLQRDGVEATETLMQGAQALAQEPELIWPVLHHCLHAEADTGAFTALARHVPESTWMQWLLAAPPSQGWARSQQALRDDEVRAGVNKAGVAAGDADVAAFAVDHPSRADHAVDTTPAWGAHAQALLQWVRRHPQLAQKRGEVLTVWLAALGWAEPARGEAAGRCLRASRRCWREAAHAAVAKPVRASSRMPQTEVMRSSQDDGASRHGGAQAEDDDDARSRRNSTPITSSQAPHAQTGDQDLPTAPPLSDPETQVATAWAGALFWLRALNQPEVLPRLRAQAGIDADDTTHNAALLQALAMAMHVPVDDAVMLVMTASQPVQDIQPSVQAAANRQVAQWAQWLDDTLPDAPEPRMAWVCQRPGQLKLEPGWIELHLDMDHIDTRLRRAGLDLDPGWVPCIGAVVRICYD